MKIDRHPGESKTMRIQGTLILMDTGSRRHDEN